jgi:DNA primase
VQNTFRRPARQAPTASDVLAAIKQQIKERISLPDLAPRYGIQKKGAGWLCPLHDDHHPSFGLWNDHYCCFACGAKGDCFDFIMRLTGCTFMEAVEALCEHAGLEFPFRRRPRRRPAPAPPQERAPERPAGPNLGEERRPEILAWLTRLVALGPGEPDDHAAFQYLRGRGISPDTARAAGLGYVADYPRVQRSLTARFTLAELQASGLFNGRGNFRLYRHRLVFPYAFNGRVYGLQARNTGWRNKEEDGAKEILVASPRVPFHCDVLGEDVDRAYLTEGAVDCLSLMELGLSAVGIPGAAGFKSAWVPLFDGVPEVVVAFDNDEAGRRGTRRVVAAFAAAGRTDVRAVAWPGAAKDANEFLIG